MNDYNSITVAGNCVHAPELKFLNSGQATAKLSLGVNRSWKNKSGEWETRGSFFEVVCYGQLAENVANSCEKGSRVTVSGRLEQRSWETQDGEKRYVVELIADDLAVSLLRATAAITKNPPKGEAGSRPANSDRGAEDDTEYAF